MEISTEPKRPWTIKVFVAIFGLLYGLNLLQFIHDFSKPLFLLFNLAILISIFGIWQGRYWARNLFFLCTIPIVFLFFFASGAILVEMDDSYNPWHQLFLALLALLISALFLLIFFKPSRKWFRDVNSNMADYHVYELSWQFQLMIIVIAIVLGALAEAINAKLALISLASELAKFFSSPFGKVVIGISINSIGFLIGAAFTLFLFSIVFGIWKKKMWILIGRLMSIGLSIPLIFVYFVLGHNERINIFITLFFLGNLVVGMLTIYAGLVVGKKVSYLFENLKRKKDW